ncbi:hypothetical protein ACIQU6_07510 [Streptomyces sp. NPDC090442]|uniref:deoxynucleotide monophosphate kinase family protein n=1 Tax=Streptomyces sp. NPDC090442 TaxID=3365962 RepID=UPI0038118A6D
MNGIGIIGRARSGKDTVAARLVEQHGFQRMALADPLKDMALAVNPVVGYEPLHFGHLPVYLETVVEAHGWERVKDLYPEARRFLQRLGSEGVRDHVDPGHWVSELFKHRATRRLVARDMRPVVVPDVRFENEASRLQGRGFKIVYLHRPGDRKGDHCSEQLGPDIADYVLTNDGTVEKLHERVDVMMGELQSA